MVSVRRVHPGSPSSLSERAGRPRDWGGVSAWIRRANGGSDVLQSCSEGRPRPHAGLRVSLSACDGQSPAGGRRAGRAGPACGEETAGGGGAGVSLGHRATHADGAEQAGRASGRPQPLSCALKGAQEPPEWRETVVLRACSGARSLGAVSTDAAEGVVGSADASKASGKVISSGQRKLPSAPAGRTAVRASQLGRARGRGTAGQRATGTLHGAGVRAMRAQAGSRPGRGPAGVGAREGASELQPGPLPPPPPHTPSGITQAPGLLSSRVRVQHASAPTASAAQAWGPMLADSRPGAPDRQQEPQEAGPPHSQAGLSAHRVSWSTASRSAETTCPQSWECFLAAFLEGALGAPVHGPPPSVPAGPPGRALLSPRDGAAGLGGQPAGAGGSRTFSVSAPRPHPRLLVPN